MLPVRDKTNTGNSCSALILAAGLSERMGKPKALLLWDQTKTFLEKITEEYFTAGCEKVICTVNPLVLPFCKQLETKQNLKLVLNHHPEWGRMYSVQLGLSEAKESSFCFVQNVDNPFITSETIKKIGLAKDPEAWCSPEYLGRSGHPVLLPRTIIHRILQEKNPGATLQEILRAFPKKAVVLEEDSVLRNINTPEDYHELFPENC